MCRQQNHGKYTKCEEKIVIVVWMKMQYATIFQFFRSNIFLLNMINCARKHNAIEPKMQRVGYLILSLRCYRNVWSPQNWVETLGLSPQTFHKQIRIYYFSSIWHEHQQRWISWRSPLFVQHVRSECAESEALIQLNNKHRMFSLFIQNA